MKRLILPALLLLASAAHGQSNYWNSDVRSWAVDPRSNDYIANIGAGTRLWPDWGKGFHGIPFTISNGAAPARVDFRQDFYSNPSPYPLPPNARIQGDNISFDDRHCLVVDTASGYLYELALARRPTELTPYWTASYGARFDTATYASRPFGWSSTDAAGLPVYPGLVKYDEAASGNIDHAIRITVRSCNDFIWPATHGVTVNLQPNSIPMGAWFRLKANVNPASISSNPLVQTIIRALQVHGVIVADYGGPWYAIGAPDDRWPLALNDLKKLTAGQFEAVREPQYVQHNPVRPIVCGTVTDRLLNPVAGAMVAATGPVTAAGWTDATGNFMLAGLPQGDYSVSITSNSFQNFSKFVHIDPGTVQSLQYRLTPKVSHTISGRVVDASGAPMVGFYVQTGRYRVLSRTDGTFFIQGLSDGVYQVHAEDVDYSTSPDQTVTVAGADVKNINFTASRTGYDISVTLKLVDGTAVKSAVVKLVRPGTTDLLDYDISDLGGVASFRGAKSSYLIVPSKGGFKFTPAFIQIAAPANLTSPVNAAFVGLKAVVGTP